MASRTPRKIPNRLVLSLRKYSSKKEETFSFWGLFSKKKKSKKPAADRCRKNPLHRPDPDLSQFGGQPYRTCGSAYVIQKDAIPTCEVEPTSEDEILKRMEAGLHMKNRLNDPMPPFQSVEQRLIDLQENRLHPFYKKYLHLRAPDAGAAQQLPALRLYKCKSGPVRPDEIPEILKFNKELLEKKNIFADFKRVELPKQMVVRMVEMDQNRKPTMEKKVAEKKKEKK